MSTETDTGEHSGSAISHTEVTVACMFFSGVAAPRQEGNLADGYGKGPESQIGKQDFQDSLATLYRVMASVESGEMEPAQALASTAVSRAIVTVYEAHHVEASILKRLRTLEPAASRHHAVPILLVAVANMTDEDDGRGKDTKTD